MIQSIFGTAATTGRKSVAGVLAAFTKTMDDLNTVAQQNEVEANAAHDAAIKEAALTRDVAAKLVDLISPVATNLSLDALKAECA